MSEEHGRPGHLVRVTTEAGRELTGFLAPAGTPGAPTLLYTHGLSGALDTSFVYDLLALPEARGLNVLLAHNSGRAILTIARAGTPPGYALTGSALERFGECVPDLRAWVALAAGRSTGPVVLMGHSLGASKVTHYLAETGDARVAGLVLASPADVPGGFAATLGPERVAGFLAQAQERVRQGRPEALMPEECVIGLLGHRISAATLLDRFAPGAAADTFDFFGRGSARAFNDLARVAVPILVLYGDTGELVGPAGVPAALDLLRANARAAPALESVVVAGDHWYAGSEAEAMAQVARWALRVTGSPGG